MAADGFLSSPASSRVFNEMLLPSARARPPYAALRREVLALGQEEWRRRHDLSQRAFRNHGVTFTVYEDDRGTDQIFPFDLLPRILTAQTWNRLEAGLKQRVRALNLFLEDVYGPRRILKEKPELRHVVLSSAQFRRELCGFPVPGKVHTHIAGIDLVRDGKGDFFVLEDNLRTPSGVSYVLANRQVLKRFLPEAFADYRVRNVDAYAQHLLANLLHIAPSDVENPVCVLLTPGIYNSAYFEHVYLAKQMGIELVEGHDLVVDGDRVFMRTTRGLKQVHVIYRRVDDDWIDPIFGHPNSTLGVAGLVNACRAGGVALANALGNGVADDKAVYAFVPEMVRFYLDESPILPNVETFLCSREKERKYVIANIAKLVVKRVSESGGYGMMIGPEATAAEHEVFRRRVEAHPRDYIAQPVVELSVLPAFDGERLVECRQDLRPFVLVGKDTTVMPGGLTRVALRRGSMVVNSSQGGGSRDTWVLASSPRQETEE